MKGKTKFQTESFIHGERITSHNLLSAPMVFPFMKTIIPSSSPIFNEWDPGICAASRIKLVVSQLWWKSGKRVIIQHLEENPTSRLAGRRWRMTRWTTITRSVN